MFNRLILTTCSHQRQLVWWTSWSSIFVNQLLRRWDTSLFGGLLVNYLGDTFNHECWLLLGSAILTRFKYQSNSNLINYSYYLQIKTRCCTPHYLNLSLDLSRVALWMLVPQAFHSEISSSCVLTEILRKLLAAFLWRLLINTDCTKSAK
jgi:hypothetical protein